MVTSGINPNFAASLYQNTANIPANATGEAQGGDDGGVSFSSFLREKAAESIDTLRASETMSAKAITGEAELTAVVEAVTAAEVTLQTVVALRDRMISAYQEIMRMPI